MPPSPLDAFTPIVEAARAVLRDLDPDQVPAKLRRIKAASGARLSPPQVRKLLEAVAEMVWLRDRVREKLTDEPAMLTVIDAGFSGALAGSDLVEASLRPPYEDTVRRLRDETASLRTEVKRIKREGRRRMEGLRREHAAELARATRSSTEVPNDIEAELRALVDELTQQLERAEEQRADLERRLAESNELRQHFTEKYLTSRRRPQETSGGSRVPTDPVELAKELDHLAAAIGRPSDVGEGETASDSLESAGLPPGVKPDSPEAFDWALFDAPGTVVVDGYNVGFALSEERDPEQARRRVAALFSAATTRVLVIYDGDEALDPGVESRASVRFAPGSADDAIVQVVGGSDGPMTVVTSDRGLIERVPEATWVMSEAAVDWWRRR